MITRWLIALLSVVALLSLIGWKVNQKQAEAAERNAQKEKRAKAPVMVEEATVTRRDVINSFSAVGTIEAPLSVDLKPEASGKVFDLSVREGDRVQAGQIIARVDAPDLNGNLRRLEAAAAQARARYAEARLNTDPTRAGVVTDIQRQQAAVNTAAAQEQQARASASALIAAAQASVREAQERVAGAEATIASADAAITTAQSNLDNAKAKRERQEALFKEGATPKQNLDDAVTAEEVAAGGLKQAKQQKESAIAARNAAQAQVDSARKNLEVVQTKAQADIAVTTAGVRQNQASLAAARANRAKNPAYVENLQALEAVVRGAESDVRTARHRLEDAIVRSPMDGIVTRRYVDPGALVSPTQAIVAVERIAQVWLTVAVPEEVSRTLQVGQQPQIVMDALPGAKPAGHIVRIEPAADPTNRQFTVRIQLDNARGQYLPGTFARVTFQTDRSPNAIAVPREAITETHIPGSEDTEKSVTVVGADSTAQNRVVKTGITDGHYVVITSGVQEGEKVIVRAGRSLKDGQLVKTGGGQDASGKSKQGSGKAEAK